MANVCERCKRSMSTHDNHASCPQCRMAAGECSLDLENPCATCVNWTRRQWGKLRRSLVDARARSCQRGRQHWSAAFPQLEAWILSKPVSTSASEVSTSAIQDSKNLSGSVKAHEVRAVATSKQLFNKVDLHSVMKAGRWSSGGTFTSFYLRDLCPQADSLQRAVWRLFRLHSFNNPRGRSPNVA